jgi:drug/metabolite transporter (DMT)-like permease
MLGALAALASAAIWAFGSTRYALGSRVVGSARVNLVRATTVMPIFLALTAWLTRGQIFDGVDGTRARWLFVSVICAYAFADNVFFAAARRVGVTTAMAIASTYPLWATLAGALWRHEAFGVTQALGTLLCVGGVIALIVLAPRAPALSPSPDARAKTADDQSAAVPRLRAPDDRSANGGSIARASRAGILLALLTSLLWAGNSLSTKLGGTGLVTVQANFIRFFFAWPILAVTSAVVARPSSDDRAARKTYLALVPVSLVEAGFGSALFVYGLAHTDLAVGATLSSLAPLMSVPFALLYREERWSLSRFAAVVATVAGVILLVARA